MNGILIIEFSIRMNKIADHKWVGTKLGYNLILKNRKKNTHTIRTEFKLGSQVNNPKSIS